MSTEGYYVELEDQLSPAVVNSWEVPELNNNIKLLEKVLRQDRVGSDLIKNWEYFVDVYIGAQLSRLKFPVKGTNGARIIVASHVIIAKPTYCPVGSDKTLPLWPNMARKLEISYNIRIYAYFSEYHAEEYEQYIQDPSIPVDIISQSTTPTLISELPCMKRSKYCYTHGLSDDRMEEHGEMRGDPGCYFTINGKDYFIRMIELCRTNYPLIFDRKANKGGPACSITVDLIESSVVTNVVTGNSDDGVPVIGLTLQGVNRTTDEVKKKSVVTNFITIIRAIASINSLDEMTGDNGVNEILGAMKTLTDKKHWRRLYSILAATIMDDLRHTSTDNIMKFLLIQFGEVPKDAKPEVQFRDFPKPVDRQEKVKKLLDAYVIAIPGLTATDRIYSILFMVVNYLEFKGSIRGLTDRDVWSYKRISGPDRAFRIAYRKLLNREYGTRSGILSKQSEFDNANSMNEIWKSQTREGVCGNGKITGSFRKQFTTSCWGGGNQGDQTLSQLMSVLGNAMSIMTEIMKIYAPIIPKALVLKPRSHKPSQAGYVGVTTPQTRQCGLAKEAAMLMRVTHNLPPTEVMMALIDILIPVGTPLHEITPMIQNDELMCRVLVNGILRGWANGPRARAHLVNLRRQGLLHKHTSIYLDSFMNMFIHTDEGRVTRPLLILNENQRPIIDVNNWWDKNLQFLITNGAIEYLDPMEIDAGRVAETVGKIIEEEKKLVDLKQELKDTNKAVDKTRKRIARLKKSSHPEDLIKKWTTKKKKDEGESPEGTSEELPGVLHTRKQFLKTLSSNLEDLQDNISIVEADINVRSRPVNRYTHCEIHPSTQLDIAAGNVVMLQHSQASKAIGQANMARQATTGETGFTSGYRGSSTRVGSFFLNKPLVSTAIERMHGAYGNSLIVMFNTLKGQTIEDAIIVNANSLGRLKFFKTFTISVVVSGESTRRGDRGNLSMRKPDIHRMKDDAEREKYRWLEDNGLPFLNAPLQVGDAMVGIIRTTTKTYTEMTENNSRMVKPGEEGIVHRLDVKRVEKSGGRDIHTVVNVTIRRITVPVRGDKFTSRHGQKVTIGAIRKPEEMPRMANGAIADIIFNSHAMKRMTINFVNEMLLGWKALLEGKAVDATPFEPANIEQVQDLLIRMGFTTPGYEEFYVPDANGNLVKSKNKTFIGPLHILQLKHLAKAAQRVRTEGPTDPATRQGSKGGDNPALKMNRHDHAAHDRDIRTRALVEDLMLKTDRCPTSYCTKCSEIAASTSSCTGPSCLLCGSNKYMKKISIPFSTLRLKSFLSVGSIGLQMGLSRKRDLLNSGIEDLGIEEEEEEYSEEGGYENEYPEEGEEYPEFGDDENEYLNEADLLPLEDEVFIPFDDEEDYNNE